MANSMQTYRLPFFDTSGSKEVTTDAPVLVFQDRDQSPLEYSVSKQIDCMHTNNALLITERDSIFWGYFEEIIEIFVMFIIAIATDSDAVNQGDGTWKILLLNDIVHCSLKTGHTKWNPTKLTQIATGLKSSIWLVCHLQWNLVICTL